MIIRRTALGLALLAAMVNPTTCNAPSGKAKPIYMGEVVGVTRMTEVKPGGRAPGYQFDLDTGQSVFGGMGLFFSCGNGGSMYWNENAGIYYCR